MNALTYSDDSRAAMEQAYLEGPDMSGAQTWGDVEKAMARFEAKERWYNFAAHERTLRPDGRALRDLLEFFGDNVEVGLDVLESMYQAYLGDADLARDYGKGAARDYCLWASKGLLPLEMVERTLARVDLLRRFPGVEDKLKTATDRQERLNNLELSVKRRADRVLRTGITKLDNIINSGKGIFPGQMLNIVGGEGGGKTSLLLNILLNYIEQGGRALFFSLDMAPDRIDTRLLQRVLNCGQAKVHDLMRADSPLYHEARREVSARYDDLQIMGGPQTLEGIKAATLASGADVIALDFVTSPSLEGFDGNQHQQATAVAKTAKDIAHKWGLSVILLSQVSRSSGLDRARGGMGGHGAGGAILEQTVDYELELNSAPPLPGDKGNWRTFATLRKNREGPKMQTFEIFLMTPSMAFSSEAYEAEGPWDAKKSLFNVKCDI